MASATLTRLIAVERGIGDVRGELVGTNMRLDLVVVRLDQLLELLREAMVLRREFDALERRVAQLEGARG